MGREPLRLCILVSGTGTTMEAIQAAILRGELNARIVLVASDRPQAPALRKAETFGLPTLIVQPPPKGPDTWEERLAGHLLASGCELVVLAGFLRILKGPILQAFPGMVINIHPSLLPKFGGPGLYGTRVHAAVLSSGDTVTGATVHLVTEDVDRGPTLAQTTLEVRRNDTPEGLAERQRPLEHALIVDVIGRFASGAMPLPWHEGRTTYASSGVDTGEVRKALSALTAELRYRAPSARGKVVGGAGLFAGLIHVGGITMALTTDGVGTKVMIAEELGRWEEVGEDMVAVNVNDVTAAGALPIGLVDHIMCRRPEESVLSAIGRGLNRGLSKAKCSLLGGETAVVPEMLATRYDLSATAMGFYPKGMRSLTGEALRPGDVLIGLTSSGFHSNGYTLVRRLIRDNHVSLSEKVPHVSGPLGAALLRPTEIYAPVVEPLLQEHLPVALSHITGGAFRKNLLRLNGKVEFVLDGLPKPKGLFAWIANLSGLPSEELYKTFNMGIGFVVAVRGEDSGATLKLIRRHCRSDPLVIGHMERGSGVSMPDLDVRYSSN